jgi:hypothetical protein
MPRYINKPNITINKFYGSSKKDIFNRNFADDMEDFENEYDLDDIALEQENPYKRYSNNNVLNSEPLNHTVYHHHTHQVIFNKQVEEEMVEDYDFVDENEYVLEELPPVQQRQKKYVLRRYNQYNR